MSSKQAFCKSLNTIFQQKFNEAPVIIVRSPGRINLIGEHTDYNDGFVLPAAIDKAMYVAASKRTDGICHYIAADIGEEFINQLHSLQQKKNHWSLYINGVVEQLQKAGYTIGGFNCVIKSDIPIGAGMSSSAALECGVLFALNKIFELSIDTITMVQLCKKAENEYVGVQCGIMDQFASMFGKKNNVIKLDCRSLEYTFLPFNADDVEIVLFDTSIKHSLASSEYNLRRQQCEKGVAIIQQYYPHIKSLRDVDIQMLHKYVMPIDTLIYKRCIYVVEEIQRLHNACIDLTKNDLFSFGKKMFETHEGLSNLYAVSCGELDFLASIVKKQKGVYGARMMGGGFGGCTINLIKKEMAASLTEMVSVAYKKEFGIEIKTYFIKIDNGTEVIM